MPESGDPLNKISVPDPPVYWGPGGQSGGYTTPDFFSAGATIFMS